MILHNDILEAEISFDAYKGIRFDNTGTITALWYLDKDPPINFCTKESRGSSLDGIGLASEYGISEPIGYQDAKIGELFLKPGVGWLEKIENTPYSFSKSYPLKQYGKVTIDTGKDFISTCWIADIIRGYGCCIKKTYRLYKNQLIIEYQMKNIGDKSFAITEYCHNFISIGDIPISEDYVFQFKDKKFQNQYANKLIQYGKYPSYTHLETEAIQGLSDWKLLCGELYIEEKVDFKPVKFAVWAMEHVVSPELFCPIELTPKQDMEWLRTYTIGKSSFE